MPNLNLMFCSIGCDKTFNETLLKDYLPAEDEGINPFYISIEIL